MSVATPAATTPAATTPATTGPETLATPLTHLVELAAAEEALASDLAGRSADWASEPSALPGWTRAHVVGHLVGNALGLINLTTWAATGVETPMYQSLEYRAAEIERRAGLALNELLPELASAAKQLRDALGAMTEPVAERTLRMGSGAPVKVHDIAAVRIREVEIHRVDLAGDYAATHWSHRFTLRTLSELTPFFRERREVPAQILRSTDTGHCWTVGGSGPDLTGSEGNLLAWLVGRPYRDVHTTDGSAVPTAPAWV